MTGESNRSAFVLDLQHNSVEERITVLAFQGLANRTNPRVFAKARFWNWPGSDAFWIEYLGDKKGYAFESVESLPELLARLPGVVNGLAVWDPSVPQTRWAAANLAGLSDLLPVAPECIEQFSDLPVVEDLRGRFKDDMDAARWSARTLLPECNREMGYSIEQTWSGCTIDSIDLAVQNKAFIYHLAHGGKEREQVKLAHEILSKIGPVAPIFGWGEPEDAYCETISFHDNFIMCAEAPNLSFWTHVPCERNDWKQRARRNGSGFTLENKHYVALCTSEGDTPKMATSVQGGAWLDPNRGRVPVNWGMNPLHLRFFPALLEFYWDTATEKDYFVGGASGAGYTYPNRMPNPERWMRMTGEYFAKADMHETDAWLHFSRPVYELYTKVSGLRAFSMPCGPFGVTLLNGGDACALFRGNSGLNYFNSWGTSAELAETIKKHAWRHNAPTFSVAHLVPDNRDNPTAQGGWNPSLFVDVDENLGPEFKLVTMQELVDLALEAIRQGKLQDCHSPGYSEWV